MENYKSLIPEIANLLNTSVSEIESKPEDIQSLLGQIYVNNYFSDIIEIKKELGKIIDLNAATRTEIEAYELQKEMAVQKDPVEAERLIEENQKSIAKSDEEKKNIYFSNMQRKKIAKEIAAKENNSHNEEHQIITDELTIKNGG